MSGYCNGKSDRVHKIKARRSLIEREAVGVACGSAGGCQSLKRKFTGLDYQVKRIRNTIEKCDNAVI